MGRYSQDDIPETTEGALASIAKQARDALATDDRAARIAVLNRAVHDIYPRLDPHGGALMSVLKSVQDDKFTQQGTSVGDKGHPFDFPGAMRLKNHNEHHSA